MALFTAAGLAIGTAIGGTVLGVTAATIGMTIGGIVGSMVMSFAANKLMAAISGQDKPNRPRFSVKTTLRVGGDVPRSILLGRAVTAGSLVYVNTWGQDARYITQVIALSDYPIRGVAKIYIDGEAVTLGPDGTIGGANPGATVPEYFRAGDGDNHCWIRIYDGTQTAADPFLVSKVSSADRPWPSTSVGYGIAYAVVTNEVNAKLYRGIPKLKFVGDGARLYDATKDDTAGGVGPQRADDPSTWGGDGDDLPAVQIHALLRGIRYAGQWLYGLQGVAPARLPAAHWREQIDKCRAEVVEADGPAPAYTSGLEVVLEAEIGDAVEALLTACQGRLPESGGVYRLHVGAPGAPVLDITDDDIISTSPQRFSPFPGLDETINAVVATYTSAARNWTRTSTAPVFNPDFEAEDGGRRLVADVPLDAVYRDEQAQRLVSGNVAEARRARMHSLVLPQKAWILEPGDVIRWNSDRNGYVGKLFRVDAANDQSNLDVAVEITEVDPTDIDWDTATQYRPPSDGTLGLVRPAPEPIRDWQAVGVPIDDGFGLPRVPGIRLSWDPDTRDVDAVAFEVRLAETGAVIHTGRTDEVWRGSVVTSQGLVGSTDYEVRGRYVAAHRDTLWSAWIAVSTPDVRVPLAALADDVSGAISSAEATAAQAIEDAEAAASLAQGAVDDTVALTVDVAAIDSRVSSVEASAQTAWAATLDSLDAVEAGDDVASVALGAAAVGQSATALVDYLPEADQLRDTNGLGSGLRIRVPAAVAAVFAERTIRVRVHVRDQAEATDRNISASYSTNHAGNSGLQSGVVRAFGWVEFDYSMPALFLTGDHFVNVWADYPGKIVVARVVIEDATAAGDVRALVTQDTTAAAADGVAVARSVEEFRANVGGTDAAMRQVALALAEASGATTEVLGWDTSGGDLTLIARNTNTGSLTQLLFTGDELIVTGSIKARHIDVANLVADAAFISDLRVDTINLRDASGTYRTLDHAGAAAGGGGDLFNGADWTPATSGGGYEERHQFFVPYACLVSGGFFGVASPNWVPNDSVAINIIIRVNNINVLKVRYVIEAVGTDEAVLYFPINHINMNAGDKFSIGIVGGGATDPNNFLTETRLTYTRKWL